MKLFLKLKHWQLFLVAWGIPSLAIMAPSTTVGMKLSLFILQMLISMSGIFGWIWAIAVCLHEKLPARVDLKLQAFKITFVVAASILAAIILWMSGLTPASGDAGFVTFFILPFTLVYLACMLLSVRFAAKTMKSIELGRLAKITDYLPEFMMIWMMPLGVWLIQPRLNKLT